MPASLGPRKTGGTEWTFEYPTDVTQLLRMPVGEPHVALNFERPVSIRRIQLTSRFASEFKVWATVLDGTDSHELKDYLEVGRGSGQELAVTLPFDVASARITSLRIAQRGAGPELETLVTLDPAMITPSTGLSFQYPVPQFVARADDSENHGRSTVAMLEDGKPLRPHSLHDDIRRLGGARFSHWKDYILFSSSDGSDPRRNGRRYTLAKYGKGNEVTIQLSFDAPPVRP